MSRSEICLLGAGVVGTRIARALTAQGAAFRHASLHGGNGIAVAATPASVAVRVVGNNGNITLNATTLGALGNGVGDTISFTQIVGTSDNANLAHPAAFVDGGTSANVTVTPNIGAKVTDRTANWSFAYANATVPAPGTYGGVNTNNSRVTYTASMP